VKLGDGLKWLEYLPIVGFAAKVFKSIGFFRTVLSPKYFITKLIKYCFWYSSLGCE
jgi:hypothetical protein